MSTPETRQQQIEIISQLPQKLAALVSPLSDEALTAVSLPGEWSVAQNVHHLADSHMNSFIRFKLMLTESHPTIKPYDQDAWVRMADEDTPAIQNSLTLLEGLHDRWVGLLNSLSEADWQRTAYHPEIGDVTVNDMLQSYADHCTGHLDQIERTLAARATI